MRTNVDIDDDLLTEAMTALGTETKKETIEVALRRVVCNWRLRDLADLWGAVEWEGDLMEWRRDDDVTLGSQQHETKGVA
jgi:Arc/MetJ family transcription regulator